MRRTGITVPKSQEWIMLQRKIFSRWVKQKLLITRPEIQINDVVDDYRDGLVLMNLIEVLSESKYEGKINPKPRMPVHRIDNLNNALKFAWSKGVNMKVKPSAEQLEKGDARAALALTWGIMMKYIKIDDESGGESLNAKDALLMWCKNKTASYKGVEVTDFKKSFADGLALCAIIHKHRPKLIDWNSLNSNDPIKNLEIAQDAAEKYFGLEKYITPDEIRKLDENSMVVYVSEYYYGIAEQRKLDLAARRIKKLIILTKENDRLKAEYNKTANNFKATVKKVEKILEDRTIDNTMAGAKRRLEQFYEYKAKDKNSLIADQLDLESNYNNLAMRLSHHKRPEFKPEKGCSLKEVAQDMLHLEECEQERKVALHAELNRQIKLVNISKQHESRYNKLVEYYKQKKAYLEFREEIDSVSAAYFQLSLLDRYEKENQTMINTGVANLKKLSAELKKEKYEYQTKIEEHDKDIDNKFKELDELDKIKRPILDDHLKREEFIEKVRQMNDEHKNKHEQLLKWFEIKKAYLETMEVINSVPEASKNLDIFNSYIKEYKKYQAKNLVEFKNFGEETMKQKYQTKYSEYIYNETKYQGKTFGKNQFSDITDRHDDMDNKFKELEEFAKKKKAVLDDHLKREEFIEKVRRMNHEHDDKHKKLIKWFDSKKKYLETMEEINSVPEASKQLDIFNSYVNEYKKYQAKNLVEFKKLGEDTLKQKYQTEFSEYVYDQTKYQGKTFREIRSKDITNRHDDMDNKFKELEEFAKKKKEILDDHLKREEFIVSVLRMNTEHEDRFQKLKVWFEDQKAYFSIKEEINSVSEANTQLNLYAIYSNDYDSHEANELAEFKKLGEDTLKQKYQTKFSEYVYHETKYQGKTFGKIQSEDITNRHDDMDKFIVSVGQMNTEHDDKHKKLIEWFEVKKAYLEAREEINSVSEAKTRLNLFDVYLKEYSNYHQNEFEELKKFGEETLNQQYQTKFSEYVYNETKYQGKTFGKIQTEDITSRHDDMDNKFNQLTEFSKSKKEYLDECLKLETKKEELRLAFANAVSEFIEFIKLEVENASLREFGFTLEEVEAYRKVIDDTDKQVLENANNKKKGCENIKKELDQYKVVNNPYTSLTLDDLEKSLNSLKTALSERTQAYEVELKRQRDNDALCKKFAETADPFSKWITEQKDKITASKETLETQLGFVDKLISGLSSEGKRLNPLKDLQDKMDKAGIQNNRHTTLTLKDLEVQWQQYENFLKRKKKMLEEEIEHQKLRGITAEQMQEIEENFKQFDFDNSGTIDRKELTACLYSLGEERTPKEISKIMEEYGDGKDISYERFKDFMIVLFGDTDTKDEIINSFILINRGFKVAKKDLMELVMDDQDIEYVLKTAPQVEDGYDFHTWTEEMFAR
ncbi:alpha-actinin [Anaeramoeba ignava]|uniref:Alpha-actinin n=1 Tax=Anaeramoeba ignava TaxID=1746090 RepID=A0A9Q0L6Y0_ANAIG|nr:alpha-actinin [Anaeramoeba ignava]